MEPVGAATLPPLKPTSDEASTGRDGAAPEERDRSPVVRPKAGLTQRGSAPDGEASHPEAGERWALSCQRVSGLGSSPSG